MTSGIYALKFGSMYYIGSSKNIESRVKTHLFNLYRNKHHCIKLQSLFNRFKDSQQTLWEYKVLQEIDELDLRPFEQSWVNYLQTCECVILNSNTKISTSSKHLKNYSFRDTHEQLCFNALREI